ncbi:HIT domain-containing protein [Synechococcus sp. RS9909]|uniref:HIT domain-containing protein n=1 Tax=unclassified Synechococcus TaxID=2626047 RepID=UPI0003265E1D|nr:MULTISPECIES: HIT domain-containing protein [unclassified Synechococcus]QNI79659.1 HIT domain-containing protein [Synechococcus sp. RS9909]
MEPARSSAYDRLAEYINRRMRMSYIYQPLMLMELLGRSSPAPAEDIARRILGEDSSQIEYYTERVKRMVGRVMTSNGITSHAGGVYSLIGVDDLSEIERDALLQLCREKLDAFRLKRGDEVFAHRSRHRTAISGSIRYRVFTRAKGRCECCGAHEHQAALEVDHIIPKNHGGSDDISNFQALCFRCNAGKRDSDSTDFRGVLQSYGHRQEGCLFCELQTSDRVLLRNELAVCIADAYPVTEGHSLVIPCRHVADGMELHQPEWNAVTALLKQRRQDLELADASISGFNIGLNSGESAGQTVMHAHWHLIPRRKGDMPDPRGGVRGVISQRQRY